VYTKVLVGYDGSAEANDAVALAHALAGLNEARLLLARVSPGGTARSTARGLAGLAEACRAGVIVLGSSRRGPMGRVVTGSVAERLLHSGPCAVAVAPRGLREEDIGEPRVIGVAFDGYPESSEALRWATEMGEACGAALRVIAIHEPDGVHATWTGTATSYAATDVFIPERERLEQALADALHRLPGRARALGSIERGRPADVLAEQAQVGMDLLVAGSRGYGHLHQVMLGSVSRELVRSLPCPVLVVPRAGQPG
jgi:nucleotide-binding universal stress UspA family protein